MIYADQYASKWRKLPNPVFVLELSRIEGAISILIEIRILNIISFEGPVICSNS